jgi:hypothetical protein
MNQLIQTELVKLEKALSGIDSAAKHINKAGEISINVIEAVKQFQKEYEKNLETVLKQYELYLKQTSKDVTKEIENGVLPFIETADNIKIQNDKHLSQIKGITQTFFDNSLKISEQATNKYIEIAKTIADENSKLVSTTKSLINESIETFNHNSDEILKSNIKNLEELLNLTTSNEHLINSNENLVGIINKIDFPNRLDKIDNTISAINQGIQNTQTQLNKVETNLQKDLTYQTKEINETITQKTLVVNENIENTKQTIVQKSKENAELTENKTQEIKSKLDNSFEKQEKNNKLIKILLFVAIALITAFGIANILIK